MLRSLSVRVLIALVVGLALGAVDVALTGADLAAIERAVPADAAAGDRYPAHGMVMLDSERRAAV